MENGDDGVYVEDQNTKLILNNYTMHHNHNNGLYVYDLAVVDLHGENTDVHSNNYYGINAGDHSKVHIHLPSQHNTSHDNGEQDRDQYGGGDINNVK